MCGRSAGTYTTNLGDLQRDLMGVKSHPTKKNLMTDPAQAGVQWQTVNDSGIEHWGSIKDVNILNQVLKKKG
jgi:hypothetical protein